MAIYYNDEGELKLLAGGTSGVYRNPDWSRVVDLTTHAFSIDAYVVPEDGIFIVCRLRPVSTDVISTMLINGNPFIQSKSPTTGSADVNSNTCIPVAKGDSITIDNPRIQDPIYFVPYKSTVVENRIPLNYTTTEQFTGKYWIDGKPIYRKYTATGTLPNNTRKLVPHNVSNLKQVISVTGMAYDSNGNQITLPFNNIDVNGTVVVWVKNDDIVILTTNDLTAYTESFVIIEYTKN